MTVTTANAELAAHARAVADDAAPGMLARKAAGAACIALATTRSLAAARDVLDGWNGPGDVKTAAAQLLHDLASMAAPTAPTR